MLRPLTLVDRGGTFTDIVHVAIDGRVTVQKVRSDRAIVGDLTQGDLRFGTTVATNALLERTGVRTLALLDEGLADLPWIGDMTRPSLFEPEVVRDAPLCQRAVGVRGRMDADGREVDALVLPDPSVLDGFDAVAIVRLFSPRNPAHEHALAAWVREHRPSLFIALGHEVAPALGLLARLETTLVHAALTPVLQAALAADGLPAAALTIRSDGSLCPARELTAPDAILSGPAGGVLAVREVARRAGFARAIGLDMGGTSTDVCRVDGGLPYRTGRVEVGGIHLSRDSLAVDTIAAGGGSVLWSDGERLGVGPRSAGASPGPQCYGQGGPPSLTDAALACGLVDPEAFDPPLNLDAVDLPGPAAAFLDLAREQMAGAVRKLALGEGADVRDHVLVAFGGAAGQHAVGVAERLGMTTVLVPAAASVLSAWGQALAQQIETEHIELFTTLDDARLAALVERHAAHDLEVLMRVAGTDSDLRLPVDLPRQSSLFHAAHNERFGFPGVGALEVRALVVRRIRSASLSIAAPQVETTGDRVVHLGNTSVAVPSGWRLTRTADGLRLDRVGVPATLPATERTPGGVALWSSRFMASAVAAGVVLQRTARSVNIRERLDFSCAVFDSAGVLVANAPHIPVHLGAMGVTVRSLVAERQPAMGTHWLCNDPAAGGSHLPDLTVITVGRLGERPVYVGSRAHHVDVGGLTPGSMPPQSRCLADEGLVFRHVELGDLEQLELTGCRLPAVVRADLRAQIAANTVLLDELASLGPSETVHAWMAHTLDATEALTARFIATLPTEPQVVSDRLQGVPIELRLQRVGERLQIDLTGTGGPHPGNLNAPESVVRAAVLYALRVLLDTDLPLNEGVLRRVDLTLPSESLVSPPAGAAVVGGNVETSMRIADLVLRAAGRAAGSAGTMNNLTLGGNGWAFYETLGGGQGGTSRGPGASARQLHMTNTRATDPEVLEHRLPVRVRRFAIREGSGGAGTHPGGDGLVRELELLEPATAALLATRRDTGAPGLGGQPGQPGHDQVCRSGQWEAWTGEPVELAAGDRVRVETPGGGGWGSRG